MLPSDIFNITFMFLKFFTKIKFLQKIMNLQYFEADSLCKRAQFCRPHLKFEADNIFKLICFYKKPTKVSCLM